MINDQYCTYFETVHDTFPIMNLYFTTWGCIPNIKGLKDNEVNYFKTLELLKANGYLTIMDREYPTVFETWLQRDATYVNIIYYTTKTKKNETHKCNIYYATGFDVNGLTSELREKCLHKEDVKGNILLIQQDSYGLNGEEYFIKSDITTDEDLVLNYGEPFLNANHKIISVLSEQDSKGIVLLHGMAGTGKSHYLKYLCQTIPDKEILWLPPTLSTQLCTPQFLNFLMNYKNSILIIEDAELVLKDRMNSADSGASVSNILNLTDGILSDCLHIQIIATFNTDKNKIDQALMRKGRLIAEYEFCKLSVDESNKMLKHLGIDHVSTKEMTLADIYNFNDQIHFENKNKKSSKIGLKNSNP